MCVGGGGTLQKLFIDPISGKIRACWPQCCTRCLWFDPAGLLGLYKAVKVPWISSVDQREKRSFQVGEEVGQLCKSLGLTACS